ncbi:MAG: ABC transporter permease [Candidatus Heimdallarchaeota archaeon]|nr:MAG: ABC transporter permease [Candidatus Heimdallarchaeota archaeon]
MKYKDYVLKRVLFLFPILLGVSFITWFLIDSCGDPLAAYIDERALDEMTLEEIDELKKELGMNQPWYIRFTKHIFRIFQGDWGTSGVYFGYRPVFNLVGEYFPATIELAFASMILSIVIGVPLGVLSAVKTNQKPDMIIRVSYLTGFSLPVFYLGMLISFLIFQVTFEIGAGVNDHSLIGAIPYRYRFNSKVFNYPHTIVFGVLPSTGLLTIDSLLSLNPFLFIDATFRLMLPGIVLAISQIAIISRMTRMAMIETMKQDYILLARAKGLPERIIIYKHALRNAILPTLTIGSLVLATLLTGTVLVETVFYWPGLGTFVTTAISTLDMPCIQGFVLISTFLYVGINLAVDLLYGVIDPRIREKMS